VGGPIVGWIGQEAGARWSLVVGGAATLVCGIAVLPALSKIDRKASAGAGSGDLAHGTEGDSHDGVRGIVRA
jgi:hypothetical protein